MLARERHEASLHAVGVDPYRQARDDAKKLFSLICRQSAPPLADQQDAANLEIQHGRSDRPFAAKAFNGSDRARLALIGTSESRKDRGVDHKAGRYLWPLMARTEQVLQRRFCRAFAKARQIVDGPIDLGLFETGFRRQARDAASMPGDDDRFAAFDGGQKLRKAGFRVGALHFSHEIFFTG